MDINPHWLGELNNEFHLWISYWTNEHMFQLPHFFRYFRTLFVLCSIYIGHWQDSYHKYLMTVGSRYYGCSGWVCVRNARYAVPHQKWIDLFHSYWIWYMRYSTCMQYLSSDSVCEMWNWADIWKTIIVDRKQWITTSRTWTNAPQSESSPQQKPLLHVFIAHIKYTAARICL